MARKITIEVLMFEKGDRVLTPEGEGVVVGNEMPFEDIRYRCDVDVLLDEATSYHTNRKMHAEADCLTLIEKEA